MKPIYIQKKKSTPALDEATYEKELGKLQKKLSIIQQAYFLRGYAALIVLEGIDAAGKGGLIRRMTWALDPRGFRVVSTSAARGRSRSDHFLRRFWKAIPRRGTITIFDRSWYGRVLVERVEGLIKKDTWKRAYEEINAFEATLLNDRYRVIKVFLDISYDEQMRRFRERLNNPEKRWKLTQEDFRNRGKKKEYEEAFQEMFKRTSTELAPWTIISSDDKKWARLEGLRVIVEGLSGGVDLSPPSVDRKLKALLEK